MASRLALAFAAVALLAVACLGLLTWATAGSQVTDLAAAQDAATARDIGAALSEAYTAAGSWSQADLRPALMLAAGAGAALVVRDDTGAEVTGAVPGPGGAYGAASALGPARGAGFGPARGAGFGPARGAGFGSLGGSGLRPGGAAAELMTPGGAAAGLGLPPMRMGAVGPLGAPQQVTLEAGGRRIGTAVLWFPVAPPAEALQVQRAFGRTVLGGGALAAALAAAAGLLVARGIVRPLRRLTTAAHSLAAGDRSARVGSPVGPAELGELGRTFDRMADSLERADVLRRAFAADVAHELRTPLAVAQGELEALVDGVEAPTPERLASLHEEMVRLGRIVQDVETLAAAEAARFRLERRRLDLAEVAAGAVEEARAQAESSGLAIESRLSAAPVEADRARLEQIIRNLLGNAFKFTPAGGTVGVSVAVAGGEVRLSVEDTGPGIPDDELPHIFERFWRGRAAEGTAGSGVGLAVVAELVRAHGGRLQAANRPGGGARFTVSLPRA